jgi:hypothetical protein
MNVESLREEGILWVAVMKNSVVLVLEAQVTNCIPSEAGVSSASEARN